MFLFLSVLLKLNKYYFYDLFNNLYFWFIDFMIFIFFGFENKIRQHTNPTEHTD
jgi:hypothetical protein